MQVNHLEHCEFGIYCTTCGEGFPQRWRVLRDPEAVLAAKENIAAKHTCRKPVSNRPVVKVLIPGIGRGMDSYWRTALRHAGGAL